MRESDIVRFEQSRNLRYQSMIGDFESRVYSAARRVNRPANNDWVAQGLPTAGAVRNGALIGRVSLDITDPDAGRDFYIGPRHMERDGFTVFSWAAPVASTFFHPCGQGHNLGQHVNGRRTFTVQSDQVVDYEDNFGDSRLAPETAFPLVSKLDIKRPPGPASVNPSVRGISTTLPFRRAAPLRPTHGATVATSTGPPTGASARATAPARQPRFGGLRAGQTVLRSLAAPRGSRLGSVLATLQADQFAAVRQSAEQMWIFDGGPGTGKTVVAAHRACYLVDEARGVNAIADVLLVGPTSGYQRHVSGIVKELDHNNRVRVTSVSALMMHVAGLSKEPVGSFAGELYEVEWERLADCFVAADEVRRAGGTPTVESVYETLRERDIEFRPGARGKSLAAFKDARTWLRYLPLLAAAGLAAGAVPHRWSHIVVDEAQDVRPLEWAILDRLRAPGGAFTVLGDLRQRRHHAGYVDWKNLVDDLRRNEPDLQATRRAMSRSYRSTAQILDYARRLLPTSATVESPLRTDGPAVLSDEAVDAPRAVQLAITHAERLMSDYSDGTTAILTVQPASVHAALLKRGYAIVDWRSHEWRKPSGGRLYLLNPTSARGLEFDAVVVLEPGEIPTGPFNGTLYTTLTRANKELRVVYSTRLPDGLRRR